MRWTFTRSDDENNHGAGYVDAVQWTGSAAPAPEPPASDWHRLTYTYDVSGRRIAKAYDGELITSYVYDGDSCIAEYDINSNLKRKYIYGPGVDEPVSMTEAAGSYAGTYYYHFDALGSVMALTNSSGNTVEVYEYGVFGQVGASDPNHPNRFMFTGREFDKETGLYYYRARYYNPQIGRFLQADPVGYKDGMNRYVYCRNNPPAIIDPSGLASVIFYDGGAEGQKFTKTAEDPDYDYRFDLRVPADIWKLWTTGEGAMSKAEAELEFVRRKILDLRRHGVDLTDVYFADDGWDGKDTDPNNPRNLIQVCQGGISLGDAWYCPGDYYGDAALQDFASMLGSATAKGTTIHMIGCYEGRVAGLIAEGSGRKTTGFTCELCPATNSDPRYSYFPGSDPARYVEYGPSGEKLLDIPAADYFNNKDLNNGR